MPKAFHRRFQVTNTREKDKCVRWPPYAAELNMFFFSSLPATVICYFSLFPQPLMIHGAKCRHNNTQKFFKSFSLISVLCSAWSDGAGSGIKNTSSTECSSIPAPGLMYRMCFESLNLLIIIFFHLGQSFVSKTTILCNQWQCFSQGRTPRVEVQTRHRSETPSLGGR